MIPCVVFLSTQSINLHHVIHVQHMHEDYDASGFLKSQDIIARTSDIPTGKTLDEWTNCLLVRMNTGWQWPLHGDDIQTFLNAWHYWNYVVLRGALENLSVR